MKVFLKITFLLLFFILLTYLSIIGIETNRFNNQIQSKTKKKLIKIFLELNQVKIVLNPFKLKLNIKTLGPKIINQTKTLD